MSKVTNTSKDGVNPHWVMGGNPGAIEEQEAQGQKELMNSTQLPAKVDEGLKKELEEAGVVFGEPDANDPLFCDATLPPGWKKQATDHSMWSKLVELGYETDRFWHSPHIAEALEKNPAFAELKKQYPHEDH